MDDRLREFGEVPGYEFDWPRAAGRPAPMAGDSERARQPWSQPPPGSRARPQRLARPWPEPPEDDPPAGPGRPALLARDTLAAMRARSWLTGLAAPLVAAIAVGGAAVIVLGANNGGASAAPSGLAAGFAPARSAAADFGGGGRPVEVSAIAAAGATEVAAGSANRGCAPWVSAAGGSTRGAAPRPGGPGWRPARPAGWPAAAPRP